MRILALHVLTPHGWRPIASRRTRHDDLSAARGILTAAAIVALVALLVPGLWCVFRAMDREARIEVAHGVRR